ncbi:MAG TPA: hypothetical protein VF704_12205 [Allosphingosinicella sp.]|jgi:hypothetical protein
MLLTALTLLAAQLPPQPMTVTVGRDLINDRVRYSATLLQGGNRLVVGCEPANDDGPYVVFHSRRWLARGHLLSGRRKLTYRFDNQAPRRMFWEIDDRRAELERDRRVDAFVRDIQTARRLVIRARDMEERRFDTVFDLRGAGPAVSQVLRSCAEASQES